MVTIEDHFALKWNNFHANFASSFHDLLESEDLVDVTISAEGKFIQAHKIILSVCSPYFKELFKVNPCKHPVVILKDVRHQELSDVLDFMYRGEVNVRQEDLQSFLKLAESLKVKGLASEKDEVLAQTQAIEQRKSSNTKKKKIVAEHVVYESEAYAPSPAEPKRKRRRAQSPIYKTERLAEESEVIAHVPASPKQETVQVDEVEFLEEATADPLEDYMVKDKNEATAEFEESNLELTGDEGQEDEEMSGGLAGPSGIDDTTDQIPPGQRRKTKGPTPIWRFFQKATHDVATCVICSQPLKLHNTSVLVRHLRSRHASDYEEYRVDVEAKRKLRSFAANLSQVHVKRVFVMKEEPGDIARTDREAAPVQDQDTRLVKILRKKTFIAPSEIPAENVVHELEHT